MNGSQHSQYGSSRILLAVVGALAAATAFSLVSLSHEKARSTEMAAARDRLSATLYNTEEQAQTLQRELNDARAEQTLPPVPPPPEEAPPYRAPRRAAAPAPPSQAGDSDRWQAVQDRLDAQGKQIEVTRDAVAKTRDDLQDKIAAANAELTGSITRTHEQVARLAKAEEPSYYRFTLSPAKEFQKVGPVQVELRKVNARRASFDLSLMVADRQLDRKHVNLDEPVWISLNDGQQPAELVVTQIDKDQVEGYIRVPKTGAAPAQAADPAPATPAPASRHWYSFLPRSLHRQ